MIERFIPQYWINLLREEIQKTPIGGYVEYTDDFQNWGDTSVWTSYGRVTATHGMYFNFFVSDVDKLQTLDQTAARTAVYNSAYHIYADIEQFILSSFETEELPPVEKCRVILSIPRIRAYQPERGFCEGIKGLVLCGLIKIGDGNYDFKPRPYQPD